MSTTIRASTRPGTSAVPRAQARPQRLGYNALIAATWVAVLAIPWWFYRVYLPEWSFYEQLFKVSYVPASTPVGRWFGIVGALLFLFLICYGLRRTGYHTRAGRMPWWYRAHLLLGLLALALVGCHSGFAVRSPFYGALQVGFWGAVLTGVFGWAWVFAIKRWIARHEWQSGVWSALQIQRGQRLGQLRPVPAAAPKGSAASPAATGGEAPAAPKGVETSAAPKEAEAPPASAPDPLGPILRDLAARRAAHIWQFRGWEFWDAQADAAIARYQEVKGADAWKQAVEMPRGEYRDKPVVLTEPEVRARLNELNRVEVLLSYHRWLRGWTTLHLVLAAAAVQLVLWHVLVIMRY